MTSIILDPGFGDFGELRLGLTDEQVDEIAGRVRALRDRGVAVSHRAWLTLLLAIDGMKDEPPSDWPEPFRDPGSVALQDLQQSLISALTFYLLSNFAGKLVGPIDMSRAISSLSFGCGCLFPKPNQIPYRPG